MPQRDRSDPTPASRHATAADLDTVIGQLVDELTAAIEQVGPEGEALVATGLARSAVSRIIAYRVLSGWLDASRDQLSDPTKADHAASLIESALHTRKNGHPTPDIDVSTASASAAAERLAGALGDDVPMAIVWIAAGLDAQLE